MISRSGASVRIEESQVIHRPPDLHVAHANAMEISFEDATRTRDWFHWRPQTLLPIDEAHLLAEKRQQSRLKTIPSRPDLTLLLITSEPDRIEASIRDRCAKIRLGPLSARELKPMVERACQLPGIPYDSQIVPALNARYPLA